jgi:hypothetical protein
LNYGFGHNHQTMKNTSAITLVIVSVAGATAFAGIDLGKLPPAATKKGVTYASDIKPMLQASCFRCHGAERPKAGLRLDSLEGVLKGSKEGPVVVAGDSAKSFLVEAVSQLDPETAMPPKRGGRHGGLGGPGGPRGTNAPSGGPGQRPGGPGGPGGNQPPAKPLTPEQVGLVRAWIDQGAK